VKLFTIWLFMDGRQIDSGDFIFCREDFIACSGCFRCSQWMGFEPKRAGGRKWSYSDFLPPGFLIGTAMNLAMMRAA